MGCSSTKTESVLNHPVEPESRSRSGKSHSLPIQQSDRIVEDCIVVRLLDHPSIDNEPEKTKLCAVVATIKTFTDRDECTTFIINHRMEKIFLILSSIESLLDSVQTLPQIEKVYVLHPSFRQSEENIEVITALTNVFHDIDGLCKQLKRDVEACEFDLLLITASVPLSKDDQTSATAKKQEAMFLYAQLAREILYRLKFENNAKNDFVHFCRSHYASNSVQSHMIDDFENNYRPQKALWWLTHPCFISRVLQRMQRTYEIDILYKLGFLLKHAHTQLTIFQENSFFTADNILVVYRGKTMFSEKFDTMVKNNQGGLLSFGNFFTAQMDKEGGVEFVRRRLSSLPHAAGVLFEIHINSTIHSVRSPFASLETVYDAERMENNAVIFGMGPVFRIECVEPVTDECGFIIWNVKLTMVGDDDSQLLRLVAPLRSSEVHANPLSYVGRLFIEMGEYTRAEQFFLGILQDASVRSQPRRLVRVHNGLGANYMVKGDFDKALEQYQEALNVSLSYLPPTHTDLAPLYDAIGKSYFNLADYQKAVTNYERAADLVVFNAQASNDQFVNDLNSRLEGAKRLLNKKH